MPDLKKQEVGVMFWAGRDQLADFTAEGIHYGQLGAGGDYALGSATVWDWSAALAWAKFHIVTVVCAYEGESYADIETVRRTVGFIPPATREARVKRTLEASDFAAALGVKSIACHIGFVPHDAGDPDYQAMLEVVRRICDHAAQNQQTFALETGQEPAGVLLDFLQAADRANLGINFDPANMILYGMGDPIDALDVLAPHVLSVHCKDGVWPLGPGALGVEVPLGSGAVGIERFLAKLREIGFHGPLNIEREVEDQQERLRDIRTAAALLRKLGAAVAT